MSQLQFITEFLNIKEEQIAELKHINQSDGTLLIKIKLKLNPTFCPICKDKVNIHGYYEKKLTHSTLVNRKCFIVYSQRRFKCPKCAFTFSEPNPFASKNEGLTHETKINILKDLKRVDVTYTATAERFNISKQTVLRVFDKHVKIARKPLPTILSLDEHYFPESDQDSLYCCVLMNFRTGELIDVLPDRRNNYLVNYFGNIKHESFIYDTLSSELDNVKYISMDMYETFRDIARIYFPNAVRCVDSFHVIRHLVKDFNLVRLKCRRQTEDKQLAYLLTKFSFVFGHNQILDNPPRYNKVLDMRINYRGLRDYMLDRFPCLATAYNLKEYYINMNAVTRPEDAKQAIENAIRYFSDCGISEYDEFYGLLKNWKEEIINSFNIFGTSRINNSYIESKNRQIERLIYNANGYQNFKRTRNRILYCLNQNDTYCL